MLHQSMFNGTVEVEVENMTSQHIGVLIPATLLKWLDEEAEKRGMTRSRTVATILLEQSGLDLELPSRGRRIETERKKAIREIGEVTGQVPIPGVNLPFY